MDHLHSVASMCAGLGFFLAGLNTITECFGTLTNNRLRSTPGRYTGSPVRGFGWGVCCGAVTQTATVPIYVLAGMVSANLTNITAAGPVLLGVNIGTAALIYVSSFKIEPFVLLLTGISGITLVSTRFRNWHGVSKSVFGIGMLFIGLYMLQEGATALANKEWFPRILQFNEGSFVIAFVAGTLFRVLLQSGTAVTVLVVHLFATEAIGIEQSVMTIYGINFGAALSTWLLSQNLKGPSREIINYQIRFDLTGAAILVPLFYLECYTSVPLLIALITRFIADPACQMASFYLMFNVIAATAMVLPGKLPESIPFVELRRKTAIQTVLVVSALLCTVPLANSPTAKQMASRPDTAIVAYAGSNSSISTTYENPEQLKPAKLSANATVDILLEFAGKDIDELRLTIPAGNNAMEKYGLVLILDPENTAALTGLDKLASRYLAMSRASQLSGRHRQSKVYLRRAAQVKTFTTSFTQSPG